MQTSEFGKSKGFWKTLSEGTWSEAFDGLGISLILTSNPSIQVSVFHRVWIQLRLREDSFVQTIFKLACTIGQPKFTNEFSFVFLFPSQQYTAFDQLKQRLLKGKTSKKIGTKSSPEALSAFSAFMLGAVSKCVATCLTYPAIRWIQHQLVKGHGLS